MKITKIAQTYEMIPQTPGDMNDPNIQLQNLQNAQGAISYFESLITSAEGVLATMREFESNTGLGDVGMRAQFQNTIREAAQATPAFNLLAQMNLIGSIDNLLNQNELNNVKNIISTNIASLSSQY